MVAGFTQGVTGFGFGLLAIPLLSLFIDIKAAVPLCSLLLNTIPGTPYLIINNFLNYYSFNG
jgi:uncharacterized membrane protein YfcA